MLYNMYLVFCACYILVATLLVNQKFQNGWGKLLVLKEQA